MHDIVKTTVMLTDMRGQYAAVNEAYVATLIGSNETPPARCAFQVAALPMPGALVEIEAIAHRRKQ